MIVSIYYYCIHLSSSMNWLYPSIFKYELIVSILLCRGAEPRHTVVRLFVIMPRAELRRHTVIVLSVSQSVSQSVCLLQVFLVAHWKLSAETSKTSRYRYLLGSDLKKFGSKASFVSYGVIYLPWLPWLAIWTLLKTKPPTLDFLEACRFHLYYRIAWRVQRNRAKKLWQSLQLSHSRTYWYCSHAQLIKICLASVFA